MKKTLLMLLAGLLWPMLTGCQKPLVFSTHTSIGLDISGTAQYPNKVSLSYQRFEGAVVPRKEGTDNEAHSIFGGLDADFKFGLPPEYEINQVFSTGEAAKLAAAPKGERPDGPQGSNGVPAASAQKSSHRLVFLTGTTFGFHLDMGESQAAPSALLGYRRSELAIIPVPDATREVRSVYADIQISTRGLGETNAAGVKAKHSTLGGVRMSQSFATGAAAETLARNNDSVRDRLDKAAGVERVREFSKAHDEQEVLLLLTVESYHNGDESQRAAIEARARGLGLYQDTLNRTFPEVLRTKINPNDPDITKKFRQLKEHAEEQ